MHILTVLDSPSECRPTIASSLCRVASPRAKRTHAQLYNRTYLTYPQPRDKARRRIDGTTLDAEDPRPYRDTYIQSTTKSEKALEHETQTDDDTATSTVEAARVAEMCRRAGRQPINWVTSSGGYFVCENVNNLM